MGEACAAAVAYDAVSGRTRSRTRVRSAANTPPESSDDDDDDRPRGRKRRSSSRKRDDDCDDIVAPSGGRNKRRPSGTDRPTKRSRTQSRDRSPDVVAIPTPPPRQMNKEEDDKALNGYLKGIADLHRDNNVRLANHGIFGQEGESSKRGIHAVARGGKLPASCLPRGYHRRWGSEYPEGYYDSDPTYYSDPDKLNPPKTSQKVAARAATSGDEHAAGPSNQTPTTKATATVPSGTASRSVTRSTNGSGALEVTVANTDTSAGAQGVVHDDDVLEVHANEDDLLATPILRPTRSFENKEQQKSVRINMGGVQFHVLKGIRSKDRQGDYILKKQASADAEAERVSEMSDQEEYDFINAKEAKKDEKKAKKRARWATLNAERLQYVIDNNIYCNPNGDECTTGEGVDAFEGEQGWQVDGCAQIMAREIVTNASLVPVKPPTWQATVDAVAVIEEKFDPTFSNDRDKIDPSVDLSLVRAREFKRLNGLWSYVMTRAIVESERLAGERLVVDKELVASWLAETGAPAIDAIASVESDTEIVEISDDESTTSGASDSESSDGFNTDSLESFDKEEEAKIIASLGPSPPETVDPGNDGDKTDDDGDDDDDESGGGQPDDHSGGLDVSVPWEEFQLDAPADIRADADAAGLSKLDQNKLTFLANYNKRLLDYAETGEPDEYLYRQITMG